MTTGPCYTSDMLGRLSAPLTRLWSDTSLVVKLSLVFGLLIALFIGILGSVSYGGAVRIMEEEAETNTRLAIEQVRNTIDSRLEAINKDTYIIFSNPDVLRALANPGGLGSIDGRLRYAVEKLMTDVAFSNDTIDSLALYDFSDGKLVTNAMAPELSLSAIAPAALVADGRFAPAYLDEKRELLGLVRLVRDAGMKKLGFLRADARGNAFREAFPEELLAVGASFLVLHDTQVLVAAGPTLPTQNISQAASARDASGSFSVHIGQSDYAASFFQTRNYDLRVVGFVPSGRISEATLRLRGLTIAVSAITILVFFLVSLLIIRNFLMPIHRIAESMRDWDLSRQLEPLRQGGTDEVAYLSTQFSSLTQRIQSLLEQLVEERSRLHRQELAALQAQINPHFLYNTLEIVNWMAIAQGAPDIAQIVRALSDMMRYAIGSDSEMTEAGLELAYVESYLTIQSHRFPDKFSVRIDASPESRRIPMPKLCLQPIVENAVLHAFPGPAGPGLITIDLALRDRDLVAVISDNGRGMDQESLQSLLAHRSSAGPDHAGIGVANVDRRLKLRYGPAYGLSYRSAPGAGTRCELRIPITGETACSNY